MSEYNYFLLGFWTHCLLKVQEPSTINHSKLIMHFPVCHKYLFLFWGFHPIDFSVHWTWHLRGLVLHDQVCPGRVLQLLLVYDWELDPRSLSLGWHLEFHSPLHGLEFHPIAEMGCVQESTRQNQKYQYLILYNKILLVVLKYRKKLLTLKRTSTDNVFCRQLISTRSLPLLDPNWTIF